MNASVRNLEWLAKAAKARVVRFDKACLPLRKFTADCDELRAVLEGPYGDNMPSKWLSWCTNAFCFTLRSAYDALSGEAGGLEALRAARHANPPRKQEDQAWQQQCQRTVYRFFAARSLGDPRHRVRHKLRRWRLDEASPPQLTMHRAYQTTPAWQSSRAWWMLLCLRALVPPRVQSAVFSALWNRWTTARRFQRVGACLLGCGGEAQDSIEHYCRCRTVQAICGRRLRLDPCNSANLHTCLLVNPAIDTKETLVVVALLVYGVYSLTNNLRKRGGLTDATAFEALAQSVREGARGHVLATKILDGRWSAHATLTSLPPIPAAPFGEDVQRMRLLACTRGRKRPRD